MFLEIFLFCVGFGLSMWWFSVTILPLFYGRTDGYSEVMRSAIAFNGSFFNTQRMMAQYIRNAYLPACSKVERLLD